VVKDGADTLKVATRLGVFHLPRQVYYLKESATHRLPINDLLPPHQGMLTTRALQEWVCLLALDLSFESTQRLLGWMTRDAQVLSTSQVRHLVREHGALIRAAEKAEVEALWQQEDLSTRSARLVSHQPPRRPALWSEEEDEAVRAALAAAAPQAPAGVGAADWERVLSVRQEAEETQMRVLARLGPEVGQEQVVVATDGVLVRRPQRRRWEEERTARVATASGYRYVSGRDESFLNLLLVLLLLCGGARGALVSLLCDGGRWIREFYGRLCACVSRTEMVLDWYHLAKKCREFGSRLCRGRVARKAFLKELMPLLWQGEVTAALAFLESYRSQSRDEAKLEELREYLAARQEALPNYRKRRRERRFVGSGHVEKANDLLVARRQKRRGMHWHEASSDGLAALKTLQLNRAWNLYWQQGQVLPLTA
jgi:hypothetical protein